MLRLQRSCRVLPSGFGLQFGPLKPKLASVMWLASRSRPVSKRSAQQLCRAVTSCVYSTSAGVPVIDSLPVHSCLAAGHSIRLELPLAARPMSLFRDGSKSAKRKAAEALLQSRFSSPGSSSPCLERTPKRRHFSTSAHVRACTATAEKEPCSMSGWCDFDVCLPHMNWNDVSTAAVEEVDNTASPHHLRLPKYQLPYGIDIYVVERSNQIAEALRLLKDSMEDSIVSIDLEWKPDFVKDTSKVALIQLSSATCCLLIRTCKMKPELPAALLSFLRDPSHMVLGYAWGSADEKKMQKTFGMGRADLFTNFLDLQSVSECLGYQGLGLASLIQMVLGCASYKSKRVSMSNWEARSLSPSQLQYAALDAILTGQVFRALRLWHSAPSVCATCHQKLGEMLPKPDMFCRNENCKSRSFGSLDGLESHTQRASHSPSVTRCSECGRIHLKEPL